VGFSRVRTRVITALKQAGFAVVDGGLKPPGDRVIQISHSQPFDQPEHRDYWERRDGVEAAVLYTTFESENIPEGWSERAADFDAVWTTSRWAVSTWNSEFRDKAIEVPIYRVAHGVESGQFPPMFRPPNRLPFTFLAKGLNPEDRKRGGAVAEAFLKLKLPDARLLIKSNPMITAPHQFKNFDGVTTVSDWWKDEEQRVALLNADCFVQPSRCEGFGMEPLEATATCLPAICTAFSGYMDFLFDCEREWAGLEDSDDLWALRERYVEITEPMNGVPSAMCLPLQEFDLNRSYYSTEAEKITEKIRAGIYQPKDEYPDPDHDYGNDAVVSVDKIAEAMEFVYEHRNEVQRIARHMSFAVHTRWTWHHAALQAAQALEEMGLLEDVAYVKPLDWLPEIRALLDRKTNSVRRPLAAGIEAPEYVEVDPDKESVIR
jgi:glycosyltransferase involved in cell wall biosynthesis